MSSITDKLIGCLTILAAIFVFTFAFVEAENDEDEVMSVVSIAWEPNKQFIVDEICVNSDCRRGRFALSVSDKALFLSGNGEVMEVEVAEVKTIGNKHYYKFAYNRGLFSVGAYDKVAFMVLDRDIVVLHFEKSSINPNNQ